MGTNQSKEKTFLSGDPKFMYIFNSESVQHLERWRKKYGFNGKLRLNGCTKLVENIEKVCRGDRKKEEKEGLEWAKMWLDHAEKRAAGRAKNKEKRKQVVGMEQMKERDNNGTNVVSKAPDLQSCVQEPTAAIPGSDPRPALPAPPPPCEPEQTAAAATGSPPEHTRTPHRGTSSHFLCLDSTNMPKKQQYSPYADSSVENRRTDNTGERLLAPLIEIPNPAAGGEETVWVYRAWTQSDLFRAVDGIPSPKIDVNDFIVKMRRLYASYRLDGWEMTRCLMRMLTIEWATVKGDWNPLGDDGEPLKWAEYPEDGLGPQLQALEERLRAAYQEQDDWDQIDRVIQGQGETVVHYEARLREAFDRRFNSCLMRGFRPEIRGWIQKYSVGWQNATGANIMSQAKHAEEVVVRYDDSEEDDNNGLYPPAYAKTP